MGFNLGLLSNPTLKLHDRGCQVLWAYLLHLRSFSTWPRCNSFNPWHSEVDYSRLWKTHSVFRGRLESPSSRHTPRHTSSGLVLASRALTASFWYQRFRTNRAAILESGVVIRFEFFELQPFKVDQFFRGLFRYFPMLIKVKYIQK